MPFDSEPSVEVTARDRMIRLRDFLHELSPDRFDMRYLTSRRGAFADINPLTECGTAACIAGYASALFMDGNEGVSEVGAYLGLDSDQSARLFLPHFQRGVWSSDPGEYTISMAVAVLDTSRPARSTGWSRPK